MLTHKKGSVSLALAGVLLASSLGGAFAPAAHAGGKGSKKFGTAAAIGGAIAGYGLLKGNKTATIAGAGIAGYSLYRRQKAIKNERNQRRYGSYRKHRYARRYR